MAVLRPASESELLEDSTYAGKSSSQTARLRLCHVAEMQAGACLLAVLRPASESELLEDSSQRAEASFSSSVARARYCRAASLYADEPYTDQTNTD